jgi:hypothetical protein
VQRGSMAIEREALGFELGDDLRAQLRAVSDTTLTTPRALRLDIVERGERPGVASMVRRWKAAGLAVEELRLGHEFDWMSHEAMSTALVPLEPVQLLTARIADSQ